MSKTLNKTVLAAVLLVGVAHGQEETEFNPADWTGAWYRTGELRARALWLEEGRLHLEVPIGATAKQAFESAPTLTSAGLLRFTADGRTITLEPLDDDRLLARRRERGRPEQREVWLRSKAPTLSAPTRPRTAVSGAPLSISLQVGGRPQTVAVEIRPVVERGRPLPYATLEGLVHYEQRRLPLGSTPIRWSGKDRSFAGRPLRPGRYELTIRSASSVLTDKAGAQVVIPLTVTPARTAPAKPLGPTHPDLDWPELADPTVGWPLTGDGPEHERAPPSALRPVTRRRAPKRPRRVRLARIPVVATQR